MGLEMEINESGAGRGKVDVAEELAADRLLIEMDKP